MHLAEAAHEIRAVMAFPPQVWKHDLMGDIWWVNPPGHGSVWQGQLLICSHRIHPCSSSTNKTSPWKPNTLWEIKKKWPLMNRFMSQVWEWYDWVILYLRQGTPSSYSKSCNPKAANSSAMCSNPVEASSAEPLGSYQSEKDNHEELLYIGLHFI